MTEHYDFEALYSSIWMHLYSWYSADTQIVRYLKQDDTLDDDLMNSQTLKQALSQGNKSRLILDLYPSKLNDIMLNNQSYYQYNKDGDE